MRNLDMTALRAFVTVADAGGVTKASGLLNLTQSAVSMQLKRLEESVGVSLLDRSARKMALTNSGEQMLSYARRMPRRPARRAGGAEFSGRGYPGAA